MNHLFGKLDYSGLSYIAIGTALFSLGWFGLYPICQKPSTTYLVGCCLLYAIWTIGVPSWFALEFIFIYDKRTPSLEEWKVNVDLTKSAWISVAVVLAAVFAVRTHLDFSESIKPTEKPSPAQNIPAEPKGK